MNIKELNNLNDYQQTLLVISISSVKSMNDVDSSNFLVGFLLGFLGAGLMGGPPSQESQSLLAKSVQPFSESRLGLESR